MELNPQELALIHLALNTRIQSQESLLDFYRRQRGESAAELDKIAAGLAEQKALHARIVCERVAGGEW